MEKEKNIEHGLKWGIIIGLAYCILLFIRYSQGGNNPIMLGVWTFIGYIIILILLFSCGIIRRNKLGGFIEMKDAFQTMFIAVLGFEFFYMAFNFIYLKYINPDFFQNMKNAMETIMVKSNVSQEQIDNTMSKIDTQAAKNMNLGTAFLSLALHVLLSGIFALLFALIIKRRRNYQNPFEQLPQ